MSERPVHSLKLPRYEIINIADYVNHAEPLRPEPTGEFVKVVELRKRLIDLQKQHKLSEETRVRLVTLLGLAG